MKIRIDLNDLKKKAKDAINDKINLGYSLKYIEASLIKGKIMANIWTTDQKNYLNLMWDAINKNSDGISENRKAIEVNRKAIEVNRKAIEVNRKAIEVNRKAIEVNRKEIVQVKDILLSLVQRLENKGII